MGPPALQRQSEITGRKQQPKPDTARLGLLSLTLYDKEHFFVPNEINRYLLGTKNKDLKTSSKGELTIYVQSDPPAEAQRTNWLPAPKDDFSLYVRAYWPQEAITSGKWTPPPVVKSQ
jgi:hypothetical protein